MSCYRNPPWGDVLSVGVAGVEPLHRYEKLLVNEPPGGASDAPTLGEAGVRAQLFLERNSWKRKQFDDNIHYC